MKVNRIAVPGIGVPGIAVAAGAALLLAGCSGTAQNSAVTSAATPTPRSSWA